MGEGGKGPGGGRQGKKEDIPTVRGSCGQCCQSRIAAGRQSNGPERVSLSIFVSRFLFYLGLSKIINV